MRFWLSGIAGVLLALVVGWIPASAQTETLHRYGLDPATALESRVRETPAAVLKVFQDAGAHPTNHVLTEEERRQLAAAFAELPPLHRRILREHLRSVTFLDGMPNTGLTAPVNQGEPYRLFDITLRAAIFHQSASEWLTQKERTCFDAQGSPRSVSIEAGGRRALLFVLLHEATHVVDFCQKITPPILTEPSAAPSAPTAFTTGVWSQDRVPAPAYQDPLRERVRFYPGGKVLPIAQAQEVYTSLTKTPFVSLYGSGNWFDDLAEYVAVYHWTEVLHQPYRIVLREAGKEVFTYEPMRSQRVRQRIDQMRQFYPATRASDNS